MLDVTTGNFACGYLVGPWEFAFQRRQQELEGPDEVIEVILRKMTFIALKQEYYCFTNTDIAYVFLRRSAVHTN